MGGTSGEMSTFLNDTVRSFTFRERRKARPFVRVSRRATPLPFWCVLVIRPGCVVGPVSLVALKAPCPL